MSMYCRVNKTPAFGSQKCDTKRGELLLQTWSYIFSLLDSSTQKELLCTKTLLNLRKKKKSKKRTYEEITNITLILQVKSNVYLQAFQQISQWR